MGKFKYEAKNDKGQIVRGELLATNESVAEQLLLKNKLIATSIEPAKSFMSLFGGAKMGVRQRAQFARQLATMIDAGLPLVQAINIINVQTKQESVKQVLSGLIRDIESGYSFSTSLARHPEAFDRVFVSIVRSGEATGKLDIVLKELADQLEKDVAFNGKIKGAMAYPIFIISAMFGVAILMMIKVIPTIKDVFQESGAVLPAATVALIWLSDFTVKYWYLIIIGVIAFVMGLKFSLTTPQGKHIFDKLAIKLPVLSTTAISVMMARLTRTLGLLVSAGIPILESLRIVSDVIGNDIYKKGLEDVKAEVERGIPMSVPLINNKNFPILFGQMVSVGEQTGRVDSMLANLAKFYTEDADNRLKNVSALIEPVVMVILGVGVAFLIFAILLPIYNISSTT